MYTLMGTLLSDTESCYSASKAVPDLSQGECKEPGTVTTNILKNKIISAENTANE